MHTKNIPVSCKLQQLLQSLRFWRINWLGCTSWHNSRQLRIRVIKVYTSYHNNYINNICVYEKTKTHNNTVCHSLSNSHFYKPFASGLPSYLCQTCSSEARAQHAFTVPCRMHKARFGLHTLSVDMSTGELPPPQHVQRVPLDTGHKRGLLKAGHKLDVLEAGHKPELVQHSD